ncbi:MAG: DUF4358 domain-containing protein [Eubacteriales bacterium]|jgi:hypothetical protein
MKKIIALVLTLTTLFAVACSTKEKELSCTLDELFEKIINANAEGDMFPFDSDRLSNDLLLTDDLYSEGYFMVPTEGTSVETVAFFKATSKDNAKKIKECLDTYKRDTMTYEKNYNADNYAIASAAVTKIEGLYVYLVMSPKKTAILDIINENLK